MESPPEVSKRLRACPGPRAKSRRFPRPRVTAKGTESQAPGTRCLTFNPDRGRPAEIRGRSEPRPGSRKSSAGYPVLDFGNRRKGFRTAGGPAPSPGRYLAVSLALGPKRNIGRCPRSHFYRGGRGMADPHNLTSTVVAAEAPIPHFHFYRGGRGMADPAFSLLSWCPRNGRTP